MCDVLSHGVQALLGVLPKLPKAFLDVCPGLRDLLPVFVDQHREKSDCDTDDQDLCHDRISGKNCSEFGDKSSGSAN